VEKQIQKNRAKAGAAGLAKATAGRSRVFDSKKQYTRSRDKREIVFY
jgi:hypothetical protein